MSVADLIDNLCMGATRFFPGGEGQLGNLFADLHLNCLRTFLLISLEYSE
jgi:hypothetical protein